MRSFKMPIAAAISLIFVLAASSPVLPQRKARPASAAPKVVKIDIAGLKKVLRPNGRPLVVNFWATWCDPCREEFPELVNFAHANKGKIDVRTVSLDDLAEIDRDVPKFLREMKSDLPAYLLKTADETAAIKLVSANWAGNLPLTIVIDKDGKTVFERNSRVRIPDLQAAVDGLASK